MIKAFIDTNILLDILLEREGYKDAAAILLCQKEQKCSLYLSSLTMANIAYILRKKFKGVELYNALNRLKAFFKIVDLTALNVESALELQANDFEDALQYFSATNVQADVIVTRNEKDFYFSNIKIVSPRLFIENIIDVNPL